MPLVSLIYFTYPHLDCPAESVIYEGRCIWDADIRLNQSAAHVTCQTGDGAILPKVETIGELAAISEGMSHVG